MNNKEFRNMVWLGIAVTVLAALLGLQIHPGAAVLCAVAGTFLTVLFVCYTRKRYRRIEKLNGYLSNMLEGIYDLDLSDNEEGELSILKNNLYKLTVLLKGQNERLQQKQVCLAEEMTNISHQLKTPLTSLLMMADLIEEETDIRKRTEFTGIMKQQLAKMNWLVQTLLKLSRLDAGSIVLKNETVSAQKVLEESLQPLLLTMDLRGISLIRTEKDFCFQGDKSWTVEAVGNILKNCVEHMEQGGRLSVHIQRTNLYDALVIEDNGSGIAPEDLPHVFERFYQGKNSVRDSVGIGLALSKAIIEKEHGKILLSSEAGVGSRFIIQFYKAIV